MSHRKFWLMAAISASVSFTAYRASLGDIREAKAVRRLYDRVAPGYDVAAWGFRLFGARRLQERAVDLLDLRSGDTVVDLGCGTGVNLPLLAKLVGERGQVVGIDLSSGMLKRARRRAERHHLPQVSLIQGDIRGVRLPEGTAAVLATASMEMIPEYDDVIVDLVEQLAPTRGRLAVGGVRRPPTWPTWAVVLGRTATAFLA